VPEGIGTDRDLPPEIRDAAGLRNEVIAWTALDPQYEPDLCRITCCAISWPFLVVPCLWPHGIILSPCLCAAAEPNEEPILDTHQHRTQGYYQKLRKVSTGVLSNGKLGEINPIGKYYRFVRYV
jgi:hypothetical protein